MGRVKTNKTLLREYARHELHSRRPGRTMDNGDVDDFKRGWEKLAKGKLRRWVADTVRSRGWMKNRNVEVTDSCDEESDDEEEYNDEAESAAAPLTMGSMRMVEGQFVIETVSMEETIRDYLTMIETEKGDAEESAEESQDEVEDD